MPIDDKTAIVQEIARLQPRLRAFVRCLLIRPDDVEDVLQEINAVLWEKSDRFQPGTDFWAWAAQIARFKAINLIRKYGRDKLVFDPEIINAIADSAERRISDYESRREALQQCLNSLPPSQRQLIDLRYASGHSIEAMTALIGRPAGSIRQTLYRIRAVLQRCIEGRLKAEGKPV